MSLSLTPVRAHRALRTSLLHILTSSYLALHFREFSIELSQGTSLIRKKNFITASLVLRRKARRCRIFSCSLHTILSSGRSLVPSPLRKILTFYACAGRLMIIFILFSLGVSLEKRGICGFVGPLHFFSFFWFNRRFLTVAIETSRSGAQLSLHFFFL